LISIPQKTTYYGCVFEKRFFTQNHKRKICDEYNIKYTDLDKGNIKDIDIAVNEYKFGNANILLSNSTLFGCGMNLENSDEILFVHKMTSEMESQVIGRAQRLGRKNRLNIIYLQYDNENIYSDKKIYGTPENLPNIDSTNELSDFFLNQQSNIILQNNRYSLFRFIIYVYYPDVYYVHRIFLLSSHGYC
jgi:hypothetical protein